MRNVGRLSVNRNRTDLMTHTGGGQMFLSVTPVGVAQKAVSDRSVIFHRVRTLNSTNNKVMHPAKPQHG